MSTEINVEMAAQELAQAFRGTGLRAATAESLTAGMVASSIASVPGASSWLDSGWIVYCDEAKARLGVSRETLARHGAVSHETARELAEAALAQSGADIAVATTGVAGPGPDGAGNPEGLFFVGIAGRGIPTTSSRHEGGGTRAWIRERATEAALSALTSAARAAPKPKGSSKQNP